MAEITINTECVGIVDAKICLLMAGMYAEENGLKILGERMEDGKVVYWFEEGRK